MATLGITATRAGLTAAQRASVIKVLQRTGVESVRHGCCIGGDAEIHWLVRETLPGVAIIGHPSTLRLQQDRKVMEDCDALDTPYLPLVRNTIIVDTSDILLACPKGMKEERRSGTWATIRTAKAKGRVLIICWPDGTINPGDTP